MLGNGNQTILKAKQFSSLTRTVRAISNNRIHRNIHMGAPSTVNTACGAATCCVQTSASSAADNGTDFATGGTCTVSSSTATMNKSSRLSVLSSILDSRQPFQTLPQSFYTASIIYEAEFQYLWRKGWLFAGYTFQLPTRGDYFTYEIGNDSIIIVRGQDNTIRAFHNTCRHRGSRIVQPTQQTKHVNRLTCPYHQWSYETSGALVHARDMGDEFNKHANGLIECHLEEIQGLIYISLMEKSNKPLFDFLPAHRLIAPQLEPHELQNAKIAYSSNYTINANWKLVYENNRECYHCAGSHPEYIKSNYDLHLTYRFDENGKPVRDLDPNYPNKDKIVQQLNEKTKQWSSLGFVCSPDSNFPGDGWYRASRMPLRQGWVTESLDGKPVSTMMGKLPHRDMGSFRIHTLPNYWIHLSSDHAVSSRLTPMGMGITEAKVDWLVHKDAIEGVDYHLDTLLPFWARTSDQDWHLCEINAAGVKSIGYRPGQLSQRKEAGLERFLSWYIGVMKNGIRNEIQSNGDKSSSSSSSNSNSNSSSNSSSSSSSNSN